MKKEKQHTDNVTRRSFLKKAWAWLGVIAGLEFTAMALNMFSTGKRKYKENPAAFIETVGNVDDILPGTVTPVKDGQFYLVRMKDGGFMALSLMCTHLGCSVRYNSEEKQFICPCHSSAFDLEGNVLNPPAPRALDAYRIFIDQGQVKVDTSRKIRRKKFSPGDLVYA